MTVQLLVRGCFLLAPDGHAGVYSESAEMVVPSAASLSGV